GQHCRGRRKSKNLRRSAAIFRSLKSSEEEKFVLDHWPTQRAAILVALQRIPRGRERIPCVEDSIPDKLEQVALKLICSRFCYEADFTGGMATLLRRSGARFELEFLHGVRKRHRQKRTLERVIVIGAVKPVTQPVI